ncbi:MAG: response regulator, partial [Chloroflexota bacterium]
MSAQNYQFWHASSGSEAIAKLDIFQPDLILLDVMMPGMDGFQVLDVLRGNKLTADIPVIFVTAKDHITDIEQGLGLGADDYIPKPVKPREVLARAQSKIEARKLRDKLLKRTTELEAMLRFSQELNNYLDAQELLDIILYLILDLLPSRGSLIYKMGEDGSVTDYRAQFTAEGQADGTDAETLFNTLIDASGDINTWENESIAGTIYEYGMAMRMSHVTQVHGLLIVLSDSSFDAHAQRIFEAIARQTTLAVRNADLYATKVHYAEHLEDMVEERTQELRSAEALLMRSEKLASVGRLAAGLAHEINNPLMPIRMNLEMMQEDIQNDAPIDERDILETLNSVNRISGIVKQLQQFTRGRGEDIPEMAPVNIAEVIESVLSLASVYIRHGGVEVTRNIKDNVVVWGNRDQLEQVFLNITLNAQAAMEGGGEYTIECWSEGMESFVRFTDTGHGIE